MVVDCGSIEVERQPASIEHQDPVCQADQLGQLRRTEQHHTAFLCQLPDEQVELVFGADIDTARGVIEQQQARLCLQPPAQDDLLLIAARQAADLIAGVADLIRSRSI